MKTWVKEEEKTGWIRDNIGNWYRWPDISYPANKWCVINNHYYMFNRDGDMVTGWHRQNNGAQEIWEISQGDDILINSGK
ncbi:MAG: hypothetical protein QM683_06110 [Lacrimispora sp.]